MVLELVRLFKFVHKSRLSQIVLELVHIKGVSMFV